MTTPSHLDVVADPAADGPSLLPFTTALQAPSPGYPHEAPADGTHELRPEPVRRSRPAARPSALRRRDVRLTSKAAEIIRRDKRRRWFAGATLVAVIGGIVVPSLINNGAQAGVKTSGTMVLTPGRGVAVDSGIRLKDAWGQTTFVLPGLPRNGSLYLAVELRGTGRTSYVAKGRVFPDGAVNVGLSRVVDGVEKNLGTKRIQLQAGAGTALTLGGFVSKSGPAQLGVRAYEGTKPPAWQLTASDTAAIADGTVRISSYLSGSATAGLTLTYQGLAATGAPAASPITPPSSAPTAGPVPSIPARPTNSPTGTATTITKPPSATKTETPPPAPAPPAGGKPNAANTGVPAGTQLKVHQGNLVASTPGATYSGLDIKGFVDIRAANVTIKNSIIRGGVATGSIGAIKATHADVRNFVLEDSEIRPSNPSDQLDGIHGGNFTIRRVEISGTVDGIKIFKDNARVENSYLHGNVTYASSQSGGKTHNDSIQVEGGTDVTITGNTMGGADNAAIMVTTNAAATKNLTISKNWLAGGGCTINLSPTKVSSIGPVTLTGNSFARDMRVKDCAVARTASTSMTASANVWADNGQPAKINVWG